MLTTQEKGQLDLSELLRGTTLETVFAFLANSSFSDIPERITEGELRVPGGSMTAFEKALNSFIDWTREKHNEICLRVRTSTTGRQLSREECAQVKELRAEHDVALRLLLLTIKKRLGLYGREVPPELELRMGYCVVEMPKGEGGCPHPVTIPRLIDRGWDPKIV